MNAGNRRGNPSKFNELRLETERPFLLIRKGDCATFPISGHSVASKVPLRYGGLHPEQIRFPLLKTAVANIALFCLFSGILPPETARGQRSAGSEANIDPLFLIDTPVAGILPATSGSIEAYVYPNSGVLLGVVYGLQKNLNLGLFYGGTNLIGSGGITWDRYPGLLLRYRVHEESMYYPAVVVGFDSHGRDGYIPEWKQFVIKSPGLFVTASKNYQLWGSISFHGGMSYTLERADGDNSPNVFVGMEKTAGKIISFLGEYSFAFDNDKDRKGFWNGSLSVGVRISTNIGFNVDVSFKNLLTSAFYYPKCTRNIHIQYVRYF